MQKYSLIVARLLDNLICGGLGLVDKVRIEDVELMFMSNLSALDGLRDKQTIPCSPERPSAVDCPCWIT